MNEPSRGIPTKNGCLGSTAEGIIHIKAQEPLYFLTNAGLLDCLDFFHDLVLALYLTKFSGPLYLYFQSLIVSMKYEKVPTPIDLVNEAIDDRLFRRLTKLCGSEKTLVVGSAKYKRIIETILVSIIF